MKSESSRNFYEFLSTKRGAGFPNIIKILIFARFWLGNKITEMIWRFFSKNQFE
jgi:hypothetical protein